jgi:hypothetical protein
MAVFLMQMNTPYAAAFTGNLPKPKSLFTQPAERLKAACGSGAAAPF